MNNRGLFVWFLVFSAFIAVTFACHGYKLKFHSVKKCHDNNIFLLADDFKMELDNECNLIPKGCVEVKPFATAIATYKATKVPLPPLQGTMDLCEAVEKYGDQLDSLMDMFGITNKRCPVEAQKVCAEGDKKVSIKKYKSELQMIAGGKVNVMLNVTHDTGRTCYKVVFELYKEKKAKLTA